MLEDSHFNNIIVNLSVTIIIIIIITFKFIQIFLIDSGNLPLNDAGVNEPDGMTACSNHSASSC